MQGYLFSKPVPPPQLAELLQSGMLVVSPPLQPETAPVKSPPRSKRKRATV